MGNTYLDPEKHFQEQNERLLADCDGHESTRIAGSHPKRSKTIIAKAKQACYLLTLATSLGLLLYCAITLHSFTQSADATKTQLFPTPNTAKNQSLNVTIVASCGDSIPEARALGCFFDAMTFQWYPPACADPDLSAEVIQSYDWRFYTRERGWDEDRVPVGAVATGKHPYLYVPMDFHLHHCTYMWKKMHRAILHHKLLDEDLAKYEHTEHCETLLQSEAERGTMNSAAKMSFGRCVSL